MVLAYYKLLEQPFGVTPDPRFLFLSPTHREALASAVYGVRAGRGFTALIAKPGMGKTTLLFDLLNKVRGHAKTAFLFQSQCSPEDMLHNLLEDLEFPHQGRDFSSMHRQLNDFALSVASQRKQLVVVIDEAQNLNAPVLEVLRMLSNFETPQAKLIQFVLAGQPQLAEKLASPGLLQLRQRISIVARLKPFTAADTRLYVEHRLRVAGYDCRRPLFTNRALRLIAETSGGIPRNINNICFNAMSLGCVNKQKVVDSDIVEEVIGDLDLRPMFPAPAPAAASPFSETAQRPAALASTEKSRSTLRNQLRRFGLAFALSAVLLAGLPVTAGERLSSVPASASSPTLAAANPVVASAGYTDSQRSDLSVISAPVETKLQRPTFVVVQPNDNLYRICFQNFGKYDAPLLAELRGLNPWLTDPTRIAAGRMIKLPINPSGSNEMLPVLTNVGRTIEGGH
jgi:general secretion pathway protein A